MTETIDSTPSVDTATCDDCGHQCDTADLCLFTDWSRWMAQQEGIILVPAGQCPKCGALAYRDGEAKPWQAAMAAWNAAVPAKPARWAVRVGYVEQNYVERDFIVEAATAEAAKASIIDDGEWLDEGPEAICTPESRDDYKVVEEPRLIES